MNIKSVINIKGQILVLVLVLIALTRAQVSFAQDCSTAENCQIKIKEYETKLEQIRSQKNTLSSQIALMNTQIYLTTTKIQNTEFLFTKTEEEINTLGEKINNLNTSLDYLSIVLFKKIVESYKSRNVSFFDLLLDSQRAASLINRIKYIQVAQKSDQMLAYKLQKAKFTYEDQKSLREEKVVELEKLKNTLNSQKTQLGSQKKQKQTLLTQTNSDERTYQSLLSSAQKQLQSFKSFVQSAGAGKIGANEFGSGSDGSYYSQRDSRWANQKVGYSNEIVLEVGCLIANIAMAMKRNGVNMTPTTIASNPEYFFSNTAYMLKPSRFSWPGGLSYVNISKSQIDSELDGGRPVIVGIYAGKYGTHYVTLLKRDGDDYIMHDPIYGPDKRFSDHYSKGSIFRAAVFK